jgi:integrase
MAKRAKKAWGDGSVFEYPEGSGIWWAQLPEGPDGKRPKRRARSEAEAYEKLHALLQEREQGLLLGVRHPTVAQFGAVVLEQVVKPTLKAHTHEDYADIYRLYLYPTIGAIRLDRLTTPHCQALINDLLKRVSVLTARNAYARLHALLNIAVQWKYIPYNVAAGVKLPKIPHNEPEPLTLEQAWRLLAAVAGHRLAALYHLALTLGLRKGELLGLRWVDLNWDAATLKISQQVQIVGGKATFTSPKTARSKRWLPVPPGGLTQLRSHWEAREDERVHTNTDWHEHGLIFPSEVGTALLPRNLSRHFYGARDAAGLPPINFHLLRHTCATLLAETGASETVIAAILGHSGGSVTRRYTHATLPAMREAVERLETSLLRREV